MTTVSGAPSPSGAIALAAPSTRTGKLEMIEVLRGLAAMSVAWFHFVCASPNIQSSDLLKASGAYGWLGVEAFFVISGFVIPYTMWKHQYASVGGILLFIQKRFVRLYPPYVLTVVLVVLLQLLSSFAPGFRGTQSSFAFEQVAMHFILGNEFGGGDWLIPVFWTLAIEFQFYFLFAAVCVPLIFVRSVPARLAALMFFSLVSLVVPQPSYVLHWTCLFGIGIAAFHFHVGSIKSSAFLALAIAIAVIGYFSLGPLIAATGLVTGLMIAYVRIRPPRFLMFLGAISYSLYLLHVPIGSRVINLVTRLGHSVLIEISAVVVAVVLSIAVSYLFYRYVERPSHLLASKLG